MILRVVLSSFLLSFCCSTHLRVMTFNIWLSGAEVNLGLQKIAKHILMVNPDVVALQEVETPSVISELVVMLGWPWTGVFHANLIYPDTAILTRHTLHNHSTAYTNWTMGTKISLHSGQFFYFWSAHLQYKSYGPYAAYNRQVTKIEQIMAGEKPSCGDGRWHNMMEVKEHPKMIKWLKKTDCIPIIFAGDFNAPSHRDWQEDTKEKHGGWVVDWPATVIIEEMGFTDSFRHIYPNATHNKGTTWSTVNKFNAEWDYTIPEPQDRIDFIFYNGENLKPFDSFTYKGTDTLQRIPYHYNNDYPSDHYALITDFELRSSDCIRDNVIEASEPEEILYNIR